MRYTRKQALFVWLFIVFLFAYGAIKSDATVSAREQSGESQEATRTPVTLITQIDPINIKDLDYCPNEIANLMWKSGVDTRTELKKSGINGQPHEILMAKIIKKEKEAQRKARLSRHVAKRVTTSSNVSTVGSGWHTARVSWYGPGFYGRTMAGGGRLQRNSMVVAHRSLAFGTKIQFIYKGKSTVAEVRDRGPYISGRTFDLGPGTARALGFQGVGTVKWRIVR